MRNLKRFRSWIALVVATSWNYLRQLGTSKAKAAEDRPSNAKPRATISASVAAESELKAAPKPIASPPIEARPAPKPVAAPVIQSKPAPKPVAAPTIEAKPAPKPVATSPIESKPLPKPVPAPPVAAESAPKARPVANTNGAPATPKADVPAKPAVQVTVEAAPAKPRATTMNEQSAQRLARVLISEIKLYYMSKMEGQNEAEMRNIYDLLKDPIDKSRQHYNQRVGTENSLPDYFHGELVKTLCAGDESRLGPNYSNK